MGDFASQSTAFLAWFQSQPGTNFHSDLDLVDLRDRGAGRGIIAKQDIAADVDLFSIPRQAIISVETSDISQKLPGIFTTISDAAKGEEFKFTDDDVEVIDLPDPWMDLILVMIYEFLRGAASPWKAYFDVLPTQFDTLMFWDDEELAELQASAVRGKIGKDEADEMFRNKVVPVVKEHSSVFYPAGSAALTDDEIIRLAHRFGSTIMAYGFELEQDDDDDEDEMDEDGWVQDRDGQMAMGMVPMADMLNADAEFNAHLNHGDDSLTMTSIRPIKAGEEVLNYYGPLPNCELLRRYGYVTDKHARHDVVEVEWDVLQPAIRDVSGKPDWAVDPDQVDDSFVLERDAGAPDEDGTHRTPARFVAFDDDLEETIKLALADALGLEAANPSSKDKRRLKTALLRVLEAAIAARLAQYSTSLADDEALLQNAATAGRRRMAVVVRAGEKQLLQEARQFAANLLARYEQADGERSRAGGEPQAKKPRST